MDGVKGIRLRGGFFIPDMDSPKEVHVELTTACNLDCAYCYRRSWDEEISYMSEGLFKKLVEQAAEMGVRDMWFAGWGEPTTHPKFPELAGFASEHFDLGMVTNGTLLTRYADIIKENFRWVFVSVDVNDPEMYRRIRVGSSLPNVEEGIRELAKDDDLEVWISTVLLRSTIHKLPNLVSWAKDVGAAGVLLSNLIPTHQAIAHEQIPDKVPPNGISEVMLEVRKMSLLKHIRVIEPFFYYRTERRCPFVEDGAFAVTYDGYVAPCLFALHDYDAWIDGRKVRVKRISFGNLRDRDLPDIWWSDEYVKFRAKVRLADYPSCNDCMLWSGCHMAESNEFDCWGNSPTCAFCPYYRGTVQCPRSYVVRWMIGG